MADLNAVPQAFQLENNTAKRVVKNYAPDRVELEIGDALQPDFKPQAKIRRWDNEVNFSIRAEEHPAAQVEVVGDVIKYKTPDYEVHMFEKPEVSEDGGFEFEWVFDKKPKTNVLTTTIQTKELDFFYQPDLTQHEIDEGSERPENVVGSYAVYHKTKRNNKVGGKEYKCGKAFHIYRPKAIDNNGAEAWCDLNIDEQKGTLTVTVPQGFLNSAAYPVVVDPTFGYTSIGGTNAIVADSPTTGDLVRRTGAAYSISENGTLDSITMSLRMTLSDDTSVTTRYWINEEDSVASNSHGEVGTAQNTSTSITTTDTFYTINFAGETLTSGTVYILSGSCDQTTIAEQDVHTRYDSGAFNYYSENFATMAAAQEDPWTIVDTIDRQISIYATYTASAARRVFNIS